MKNWFMLLRLVSVFTFFTSVFSPKTSLWAQTYCYQFDENVVGNTLEVDIIITPSAPFKLGSTTAKFSLNPQSVSLVNPIQFTTTLPATYTTSATSPEIGVITFTAEYTGATGSGKTVPTTGLKVGKMVFNIINPLIPTDIKLLNKGIKSLKLFRDDNSTFLVPSAQCPPSPYTSTLYDANVELDAEIPMNECVESNTPNSVKINFGDDETREILPAGFKFTFYCKEVTSLRLGADGALLVNADPNTTTLPTTNQGKLKSIPRIIAPWWDEWRKGMGTINCLLKDTIVDRTPTRMLIIQWNNVSPVDNITGSNLNTDPMKATFNVIIFENSSVIKFNYKDIDFSKDIATRPDLLPVVEQKQNGVNGSVGMKGICGTGTAQDKVNNILYDGPIGISLFDVRSTNVYKSITFKPIKEDCVVPIEPLEFKVCQNSTPFKIPLSSAAINGHWEGTGTPFLNNPNIQVATFNPTTAGSYKLKWVPECPEFGFDVNILVTPAPTVNAGPDQSLCAGSVITLAGTIGGSAVSGTWSAPSGTFGDSKLLASTYTANIPSGMVTLTLTTTNVDATCPVVKSTMKVTVLPVVYAGEDGALSICGNTNATTINLFDIISNEQSGGIWTRTAGSGGIFNAAAGTFTTAPDMTGSIFKYTLKGTAPCPDDESKAAINIITPADAGRDGSTAVCDNSTAEIDLKALLTGAQNNGDWVRLTGKDGVFVKSTGKFTPTVGATTSTFKYTVAGFPPCVGTDEAIVTVNIAPFVTAGSDGVTTICDNSTTRLNLFDLITGEQSGGTWVRRSGLGGTFSASDGSFIPSIGATSSAFAYMIKGTAPCPDMESIAFVNVIPQANAGADGSTTICDNSTATINLFGLISGEQVGGAWTRLSGTGGVFNASAGLFTPSVNATTSTFKYVVSGVSPCGGTDDAIATITIVPQVYAGLDGTTTVCNTSNTLINLFSLISGGQVGGVWTRPTGTGGVFDAAAGTFTPSVNATSSTFKYLVTAISPCTGTDEAVVTVNITPQAYAGADGTTSICNSSTAIIDLSGLITGEQTGGVWSRSTGTGGTFNATAGTYTPSVNSTTSIFKYVVTSVSPCVGTDEAIATVNIVSQVYAGLDGTTTVCDNSNAPVNLFGLITGEQSGGVWIRSSGTGGDFNATTGVFTPAPNATNSTFKYAFTGVPPCSDDESIATVNIVPQVNAGSDGVTTICNSSNVIIDLFGLITGEQSGGIWTRLSGTGGIFNAANGTFTPSVNSTSSTFQYNLTGVSPCSNDASIATVNIVPRAFAGRDGGTVQCETFTTVSNLFDLISDEQTGGTWTRLTGTGGVFDALNAAFTPAAGTTTSTFQYTVKGALPCNDDVSIATVTLNPRANAGKSGETTQCDNYNTAINLFNIITDEQTGGIWVRLSGTGGVFDAGAGTFLPLVGTTNSSFQYTVTGLLPCNDDVSIAKVNILPKADAGTDGVLKICSNSTDIINLFSIILDEQNGGVWTRTSGTGGDFNPTSGTFAPSSITTNSTFKYTLDGAIACAKDESIANLIIVPQRFAGSNGSTIVCSASTTPIDLYGLITGEQTGGYWTQVSGSGGTFNAALGTFTPALTATSSVFKYILPGVSPCSGSESFATVKLIEQSIPAFSGITFCQNAIPPTLPTTSINGINGTWSPAVINNQTSAVYTFTPAAGSCATTTTLTVKVIPNPKPNAGIDQLSCVDIGNQTFNLSASAIPAGSTAVWSFDGPSGSASFLNKYEPNTSVINVNTTNTLNLVWTVRNSEGCFASDTVSVGKDNIPPVIDTWDKNAALAGSMYVKGGEAFVCASIVIKELSDNCTSFMNLMASAKIVRDVDNPSRKYSTSLEPCVRVTCADLGKKVLTQVWVIDRAGNASFKYTTLTIQDNMGFCGPLKSQASVSITTETNRPVNNVTITASMSSTAQAADLGQSDASGIAKLTNLDSGENYLLKATKTDEQYLGVTTFDIATISQHILGLKPIASPYALLAADVNEDGEIDGSDVLLLRNFILRRTTSLPRRPWRFVDSSYVFKQPQSPFAEDIAETIVLSATNNARKGFKAIKKGDVFNTSSTNIMGLSVRSNSSFLLETEDILLEKDKEYAININSENIKAQNFQFTIGFTEGGATVKNIEKGDLQNLSEGNFGLFENALTTSWNGKANNTHANLFTVHFKAQKSGLLSKILSINNSITPAEAHSADGNPLQIQLNFTKGKTVENQFALHQNYPNPFEKQTKIAFNLPTETTAQLTIYNIAGQILYTQNAIFPAGFNEINVDKKELNTEGVLYYRLDTPKYSATRKMIVIK
jgi:hypothetical protein